MANHHDETVSDNDQNDDSKPEPKRPHYEIQEISEPAPKSFDNELMLLRKRKASLTFDDSTVRKSARLALNNECNIVEPNHRNSTQNIIHEALLVIEDDPQTFSEAINSDLENEWRKAMQAEYNALMSNGTWELMELPPDRKAIGSKWVFKTKYNERGEVEKYKARLVAQGFKQVKGVDYEETFSPVAKLNSIRIILAIASAEKLHVHQLDVLTAYLNSEITHEVYMKQPTGFVESGKENLVCKLKRGLYGLKQGGYEWNITIDASLKSIGYVKCEKDWGIYTKVTNGKRILLALYVDDILLAAPDNNSIENEKHLLKQLYNMKDMGEAKWILGMEITKTPEGTYSLSQVNYIEKLLQKFNMSEANSITLPMEPNKQYSKDMCPHQPQEIEQMALVPYRSAIGSLLYASVATRPDITFAVSIASKYLNNPGQEHWSLAKRIMRYLLGTKNHGLTFQGSPDHNSIVQGYVDSDWGSDIDTRRSVSGYAFFINNDLVTWKSASQHTVSTSTTEAEYLALGLATQEAMWIKELLFELNPSINQNRPITIHEDNNGCIDLTKKTTQHGKTKHIAIKHHFVREQIKNGTIKLQRCNTENMIADIFTKALAKPSFEKLREQLGVTKIDLNRSQGENKSQAREAVKNVALQQPRVNQEISENS
ncbi:hypothetical protein O9G_005796 [Rozella allomycis CSF55]|uniref:Reverse transcriptase Ty1/copia-type domain-containing protein n=1 Tax=Rozella allomycis (strain CSF55) TaxID=988480 RepID=A0A075B0V5_ROZAC|nr:hypothetical protein O9G_005796 [Rozella allomycis CSF55]|eukprot:EPZ36131.1 hypothetical protein O9G_005796 [Rozella allomycis CSF55]